MSVSHRGNPNLFNEVVHHKIHEYQRDHWDAKHVAVPSCHNGAFNLKWSTNLKEVTCQACLAFHAPSF